MKIGIEVEGHHRGLKTLFIDAPELPDALARWDTLTKAHSLKQLYIMDHANTLTPIDYQHLGELDALITIEVKALCQDRNQIPLNVYFMVALDVDPVALGFPFGDQLGHLCLGIGDQVKLTANQYVAAFSAADAILTHPSEFLGDQQV